MIVTSGCAHMIHSWQEIWLQIDISMLKICDLDILQDLGFDSEDLRFNAWRFGIWYEVWFDNCPSLHCHGYNCAS